LRGKLHTSRTFSKGSHKERTHRKLDRTETTIFAPEEETKDTERDTQSTDRFELKREAESTLKEDMSIKAGLTVTGAYGPVVATATGDFAYSTSKQDSAKSSSNFAREVVDRSVTKVQTKTKTERTTKTLNEVEEINRHSLNNGPPSAGNITGIYRWVDKHYRAQVYNYGVRLLLEFTIPEPAAFYRATHASAAPKVNAKPPAAFVTDGFVGAGQPLTAEKITEFNYLRYAAKYGAAGELPPPPLYTYVGTSLVKDGLEDGKVIGMSSKEFVVPEGYTLINYSATITILSHNHPKFTLQVGGDSYANILNERHPDELAQITNQVVQNGVPVPVPEPQINGSVAVSVGAYDVKAFAVNVQGFCQRTPEHYDKWKLQVFEKIYTAYQSLQTAYDQKVTQAEAAAGITIEGQNPAINRIVEKTELKKLCITMMTGQHFNKFGKKPGAMTEPPDDPAHPPELDVYEALYEGPIIQFFEQAFEWEQITYVYYPYFWGRKKNWVKVVNNPPDPFALNEQINRTNGYRPYDIILEVMQQKFGNVFGRGKLKSYTEGQIPASGLTQGRAREPDILGFGVKGSTIHVEFLEVTTTGRKEAGLEQLREKIDLLMQLKTEIEQRLRAANETNRSSLYPTELKAHASAWRPGRNQLRTPILRQGESLDQQFAKIQWLCFKPTFRENGGQGFDGLVLYEIHEVNNRQPIPKEITESLRRHIRQAQAQHFQFLPIDAEAFWKQNQLAARDIAFIAGAATLVAAVIIFVVIMPEIGLPFLIGAGGVGADGLLGTGAALATAEGGSVAGGEVATIVRVASSADKVRVALEAQQIAAEVEETWETTTTVLRALKLPKP
jgi:hypothetical protein